MSRRAFDRYMVQVGLGTHPKFGRLTDSEFRAHVVGVLSVAARAPIRGCLLVGELEAEPADVARAAGVTARVARSALVKLEALGVLYRDEEVGCLRVHDWDDVNPEPREDPTAAERQRNYRARLRTRGITAYVPASIKDAVMERDDGRCVACGSDRELEYHHRLPVADGGESTADNLELRCRNCHRGHAGHTVTSRTSHTEENGDVTPPTARMRASSSTSSSPSSSLNEQQGVEAQRESEADKHPQAAQLARLFADLIRQRDPKAKVSPDSDGWVREMRLLIADRGGDAVEVERVLRSSQRDSFWQGVILSPRKLREKFTQLLLRSQGTGPPAHKPNAGELIRKLREAEEASL